MFTVYGLNGRVYTGSMEGARDLAPVQAVARLRAVAPVGHEPPTDNGATRLTLGGPHAASVMPADAGARQALAAYAQSSGAADRQAITLVQQLMSHRVITVPVSATVAQAWSLLSRRGIGQAPVLNAAQRLVGLITRADLLPLQHLDSPEVLDPLFWQAQVQQSVASLMWTPVPSASPDTPVREIAQLLLDLRLPGVPVVDEQGLMQGFLSRSDLLRALTRQPPLDLWS